MDLRVSDGVQQLPLFGVGEDDLAQFLPVDLPVLQQDLRPEVVDDAGIRWSVRLHDCHQGKVIVLSSKRCLKLLVCGFQWHISSWKHFVIKYITSYIFCVLCTLHLVL